MNMSPPWNLSRTTAIIVSLIAVCAVVGFIKLHVFWVTNSGDYQTYVATSKLFAGETVPEEFPYRILKPLAPILGAILHTVLDYESAYLFQAITFYFALIVAMYVLVKEFLEDEFLAILGVLLTALSYPMLKYGLDTITETGAIFFYVASLWLTFRFLKNPSWKIFLINAAIITMSVLWKEYGLVSAVILGLATLFHHRLEIAAKVKYVLAYALLFLAVHIPFQIGVYLKYHYTYLSWYVQGGDPTFTACGFNAKDLTKSTAALLGVAWLAVPFGFLRWSSLSSDHRRFFAVALTSPFMAYIWGCISSRLLYVLAPPFVLLSLWGMRDWKRSQQITFVALTIAANLGWLFLSYSIKL